MKIIDKLKSIFPGYGRGVNSGTGPYNVLWQQLGVRPGDLNRSRIIADADSQSIVNLSQSYIAKKFIEAETKHQRVQPKDGSWEAIENSRLMALLSKPNPFWSWTQILSATAVSTSRGNSYLIKARNGGQRVVELWWSPHGSYHYGMSPWCPPENKDGIPTHYRYVVNGEETFYKLADVIHFRQTRPDPSNPWIGADPVAPHWLHLATDDEKASYEYTNLANLGIVGAVYTPEMGPNGQMHIGGPAAKKDLKEQHAANSNGRNRAGVLVLDLPYKLTFPNVSPENMALDKIGDTAEERIPAAFGLNAMVLGLGSGLERSTYSNFDQAVRSAFDDAIAPLHRIVSEGLTSGLIPEFGGDPTKERVFFDYSMIPALQEDRNELHKRLRSDWQLDGLTLDQWLVARGLPPDTNGNGAKRYSELKSAGMPQQMAALGFDEQRSRPRVVVTGINGHSHKHAALPSPEVRAAPAVVDDTEIVVGIQAVVGKINTATPIIDHSSGTTLGELPAKTARAFWQATADLELAPNGLTHAPVAPFTWFPTQQTFVGADGVGASAQSVKAACEAANNAAARDILQAANRLYNNGTAALGELDAVMTRSIPRIVEANFALGQGGIEQMTEGKAYDFMKAEIERQLEYWEARKAAILSGEYGTEPPLSPAVLQHVGQYPECGRGVYEQVRILDAQEKLGHNFAENLLGGSANCEECVAVSERGRIPIDDMPPVGTRQCLGNCTCSLISFKTKDGEE